MTEVFVEQPLALPGSAKYEHKALKNEVMVVVINYVLTGIGNPER